jgi:acyl-CoA thioesterase FadM
MSLFFRYFFNIFYNLVTRPKMKFTDTSILKFRVLLNDLDLNFHMNNGRYLTIMDIGRTDLIYKIGFLKVMLKNKWGGVATAVNINFFKPLAPFQKYELQTKALWWDENWFYVEQLFISKNQICARALVRVTFTDKKGKIPTKVSLQELNLSFEDERPIPPLYLQELIQGEEHLITETREFNRQSRQ